MRIGLTLLIGLLLVALPLSDAPLAYAEQDSATQPVVLRIASLAPPSSNWARHFRAWGKELGARSGGRVSVRLYPGVSGDEKDILRKINIGQLDGASLTTVGLGQVVRPVLLMQMPGLFRSYDELVTVRRSMSDAWDAQFRESGFELLGWGDGGFARVFSNTALNRPGDFRRVRPWVWSDDPVGTALMHAMGASGVPLSVPEVGGALQTRMVDTVFASPVALTTLQWFRHFTHMSKQADIALVGATVVRKPVFDALPADVQAMIRETAITAHEQFVRRIRDLESRAIATLKQSGIQEYDTSATSDEWRAVYSQARESLKGRVYSAESLKQLQDVLAKQRGQR